MHTQVGYSSLLLTFPSESPHKFAIYGLQRKIIPDFLQQAIHQPLTIIIKNDF